jgi:hypothetical protein
MVVELIMGPLWFTSKEKKNVIMNMELEVPKGPILKPTLSIVVVQRILQWERSKRGYFAVNVRGPWQRNAILIF